MTFRTPALWLLAATLVLLGATARAETDVGNPFCLIEPTEAALPEYTVRHAGTTYYFCCTECIDLFKANPAKYLDLPDTRSEQRTSFQEWLDGVWNTGKKTPGLVIGGVAIFALLISRLCIPKLRPILGLQTFTIVGAMTLGAEALSAHLLRKHDALEHQDEELIHWVHFATFHEYGHPPVPAKPALPPRLEATFYRGNDERSGQLYNRGYYRTCDFNLDLSDAAGRTLTYADKVDSDDLFLRVRIVRAPGTPDFFWTPKRMANIFASRSADKLLGRNGKAVPDAVQMKVIRPMWEWEILYPLAAFKKKANSNRIAGMVYHCEKRFDDDGIQIGSRFHYAFQFDLRLSEEDNTIEPSSDLWMGALYRNRALRIWEIPAEQWLSANPIPVIKGKNTTTDPKLLGIEGHLEDKN